MSLDGPSSNEPEEFEAIPEDESPIEIESLASRSTRPAISTEPLSWIVSDEHSGDRLDAYLAQVCPQYSRVQLRRAITELGVRVDGKLAKPAYRVVPGQRIDLTPPAESPTGSLPEPIPLSIVFEDRHLVVIDKPAGMVVHPARGHWSGTLTAALAYHFEHLSTIGGATRPGIVHRLDRDTSGLILVAKTDAAHLALSGQFEQRSIQKEYWALVSPVPSFDRDRISSPIGPHPSHREKMAVRFDHPDARTALTEYAVLERFRGLAEIQAFPKTGRTHQIRVHMWANGWPIVGDAFYNDKYGSKKEVSRLMLHALSLTIQTTADKEWREFKASPPKDFMAKLKELGLELRLDFSREKTSK